METITKNVPHIELLRYTGTPEKPDIKIFVSHRIDEDSEIVNNPLYIPVRCGAVYDDRENIDMLGDDTGENISEKRNSFCELTVQYWAWKNIEADYYGLCHYRRYLSFSDKEYDANESGQVVEKALSRSACEKYGMLDTEKMRTKITENDVIVGSSFDISKKGTPKGLFNTAKEHWQGWESTLIDKDTLKKLRNIVRDDYAQYLDAFDQYLNQKEYIGYNCFIMKKQYFFEMCEFQFGVLEKLEKQLDTTLYSENMWRTCGFMGEILYATYITYLQSKELAKVNSQQIVYFHYNKRHETLFPFAENNNIPVVLMSSDFYVPYLYVFLQSAIDKASVDYNYDFIILEKEISDRNKKSLKKLVADIPNVSVRFYNPCYEIGKSKFYIAHAVYAEEAYYRMLTPWILSNYDKAIVMDCDIIARKDLKELYETDVEGYLAAGVRDIVFQGILNGSVPGTLEYVLDEMKMKDPYEYINTGVLVMNLKEWRAQHTQKEIVHLANTKKFRIQEQDILNVLLEGKAKSLDIGWNYYVPVSDFLDISLKYAPVTSLKKYKKAGEDPYLVHYAGVPKPWTNPEVLMGDIWWGVARKTPMYELFISRMISPCYNGIHEIQHRLGYYDPRTPIRKFADKIMPEGTKRRKFARFLIPRDSLRWKLCKQILYIFVPKYRPVKVKKVENIAEETDIEE